MQINPDYLSDDGAAVSLSKIRDWLEYMVCEDIRDIRSFAIDHDGIHIKGTVRDANGKKVRFVDVTYRHALDVPEDRF